MIITNDCRIRLYDIFTNIIEQKGVFEKLFDSGKIEWLNSKEIAKNLDIDYILNHSGSKFITPMYMRLLDYENQGKIIAALDVLTLDVLIKYQDKWNRIYNAYVIENYKPLENYSMIEKETPNITRVETPNININDITKQQTNIITTNKQDKNADVYGFNSVDAVPSNKEMLTTEQNTKALPEENQTEYKHIESGNRQTTEQGTRDLIRTGNIGVTTSQQMLESELKLREYNFYNMVMNDIDTILTLSIY